MTLYFKSVYLTLFKLTFINPFLIRLIPLIRFTFFSFKCDLFNTNNLKYSFANIKSSIRSNVIEQRRTSNTFAEEGNLHET